MKTTLTLEDVERLEELREKAFYSHHATSALNNKMHELIPLILPVIREYVKGNPEGLPTPQGASPPVHSDVPPAWPHYTCKCNECGDIHEYTDRTDKGWHGRSRCPKCLNIDYTSGFFPIPSHSDASLHSPRSGGVEQVKAPQEGSVCEVEPLGEVTEFPTTSSLRFTGDDEQDCFIDADRQEAALTITRDGFLLKRERVASLISHLQAWVETGSFRLVPRGGAAEPLTNH